MGKVRCEFCKWEQDPEISRICDRCGKRLSRWRDFDTGTPVTEFGEGDGEVHSCPNCGIKTSKAICNDCGSAVQDRSM